MKNSFLLLSSLLTALLLSSCSRSIYQVTELTYTGDHAGEAPHVTDHDGVVLSYDFWGKGKPLAFTVHNQLDHPIVIDFGRSSVIVGDEGTPYIRQVAPGTFQGTAYVNGTFNSVAGVSATEVDPEQAVIAPGTKMSFQFRSLGWTLDQRRNPESTQTIALSNDKPWAFRHYLCYQIEDGSPSTLFIDDRFEVTSSKVMGEFAFTQYRQATPYRALISYDQKMARGSNGNGGFGAVLIGASALALVVVVAVTAN